MASFRLSKSKMLSGFQCPKRLYLEIHRPDLAEHSKPAKRIFNGGNLVGDTARRLHPKGELIGHVDDLKVAATETNKALKAKVGTTLFEPAFQHGGMLVRADIFSRNGNRYHMVEVKSSVSVNSYHLIDAAIQSWVVDGAGYPLDSVSVDHIDSSFEYQGKQIC